jgi:hypothetical protein
MISPLQRPLPDNTHNRQTPIPPAGFGLTFQASKWALIHTSDNVTIGTSTIYYMETDAFKMPLLSEMHSVELMTLFMAK